MNTIFKLTINWPIKNTINSAKFISLLYLVFICCFDQVKAQDPHYISFDVEDGLPSPEVYDIEIDNKGYIWITTDRGIVRYDGYTFKTYTLADGLMSNTNFKIFKDTENNLWFFGINGTVSQWDGNQFNNTDFNKALIRNKFPWIEHILQLNDSTFVFTPNKEFSGEEQIKLFKYHYNIKSKLIAKKEINFTKSLIIISNKKNDNILFEKETNTQIGKGIILNDNTIFYHIDDKKYHFNSRENKINKENRTTINFLKNRNPKKKLHIDYQSKIFLKTDKNLEVIKSFNASIRNSIFDNQNNLIYTFTSKGLLALQLNIQRDKIIKNETFLESISFTNGIIDNRGNFWLTTENQGLIVIPNPKLKTLYVKNKKFPITNISNFKNNLLLKDTKGNIISIDDKLRTTKLIDAKLSTIKLDIYKPDTLNISDGTRVVEEGKSIKIFNSKNIKTFGNQINLKNGDKIYGFEYIGVRDNTNKYIHGPYCDDLVTTNSLQYFQDKNENIWVGTVNELYLIQNYDYHNLIPFFEKNHIKQSRISKIRADIKNEGIWVTTHDNGVFHINVKTNIINNLNNKNGLKSKLIQNIYEENDSTIWLATNNGIEKILYETKGDTLKVIENKHINSTDGLHGNYVHDITIWNDKLWIANEKGVSYLNISDTKLKTEPPPIVLDSVQVNNKKSKSDVFNYNFDENNFNFHFTGISFNKPIKNKFYAYRLKHNNKNINWSFTNNRNVQYTNLAAGTYSFEVKARDKNDVWSIIPAVYNFKVYPHFTETVLFKLGSITLILGLIYYYNKFREKQILKSQSQKQLIKEGTLRAQKAELDALRGQMNPHFVYNAMNSIQNFIFKNEPENANHFLAKITQLMRSSLEMSKLEFITLHQEITFLKNYLDLEKMRFKNKFNYKFDLDKAISLETTLPPLILQPLIENVIKHAFKGITYKGEVEVIIKKVKTRQIEVSIIDNGIGIDFSKENKNNSNHKSLSLNIIKDRIEIINSELKKDIAYININDRFALEGTRGTKVSLILPTYKSDQTE